MLRDGFKVKVKVEDLLLALRENRETHHSTFERAFEGYRKMVVAALEKNLAAAKDGKKIVTVVRYQAPEDHTEEYDQVIQMLEMCEDETIEVTQEQFAQYVQDSWGWKHNFESVSTMYLQANKGVEIAEPDETGGQDCEEARY